MNELEASSENKKKLSLTWRDKSV